jgi:fructose-bisphosphate aldolase, class I
VPIEVDLIKQKQATFNGGYPAVDFGKTDPRVYSEPATDLSRGQLVNCYAGRTGLINSGGGSAGAVDLAEVARTAVVN